MKKALISPQEAVEVVSEWLWDGKVWCAVYTQAPNICRIAQVADSEFEVAAPLFWVECSDIVTSSGFCYDKLDNTIKNIPADAIKPQGIQEE